MEPLKGGVSDADGGESAEKDRVGDGVKCCTKVKEDEDGERTAISCNKEVISDFYEGSFGTVVGAETRLERVIKGILCKMCVQLSGNYFFKDFGYER